MFAAILCEDHPQRHSWQGSRLDYHRAWLPPLDLLRMLRQQLDSIRSVVSGERYTRSDGASVLG
jgi:hypothetical protein